MRKILFLAAALSMVGCAPKPDSIGEECWTASTKNSVQSLAMQIVTDQAISAYKDYTSAKGITDSDDAAAGEKIKKSISIELSNFYVKSADLPTGHYTCGAQAKVSFTTPDTKATSDAEMIDFDLIRGESGQSILLNKLQWIGMLNSVLETKK